VYKRQGSPTPEGWHNQLKNEIGVQVTYTRNFTFKEAHNNLLGFDLAAHYGFAAGTLFDYVNAGATIRVGNNLSGAPVGTIENPSLMAFEKPDNRAYLLARLDVRAQAHNTFVDGSVLRRDPHVSYVHSKAIIVQATVGVVLEAKSWSTHRFAFLFHRRSSEFNTPPGAARMQSFGTMMMEVDF
jgi:lipid A 3-O-deacylase